MRSASSVIVLVLASVGVLAANASAGCSFTTEGQGGPLAAPVEGGVGVDGSPGFPGNGNPGGSSSGSSSGGFNGSSGGSSGSSSGSGSGGFPSSSSGGSSSGGSSSGGSSSGSTSQLLGTWSVDISQGAANSTNVSCPGSTPGPTPDTGLLTVSQGGAAGTLTMSLSLGIATGCTFTATGGGSNANISPGQTCNSSSSGDGGLGMIGVMSGGLSASSATAARFNLSGRTSTGCTFTESDSLLMP